MIFVYKALSAKPFQEVAYQALRPHPELNLLQIYKVNLCMRGKVPKLCMGVTKIKKKKKKKKNPADNTQGIWREFITQASN